jgi:hypothetical protein
MTLRGFGGHFACFSQKDSFKVWRGRGLYSEAECGKVYTILQLITMLRYKTTEMPPLLHHYYTNFPATP